MNFFSFGSFPIELDLFFFLGKIASRLDLELWLTIGVKDSINCKDR